MKTEKILQHPKEKRKCVHAGCLPATVVVQAKNEKFNKKEITAEREECKKVYTMENGTKVCMAFINPGVYWDRGNCPLASNIIDVIEAKRKALNPIKASKRKNR